MRDDIILGVKKALPLDGYKIWVEFEDGFKKSVSIEPFIKNGISSALRNVDYFKSFKIENGYICWDNGYDICPVTLREFIN
jgi:hypothetical protein